MRVLSGRGHGGQGGGGPAEGPPAAVLVISRMATNFHEEARSTSLLRPVEQSRRTPCNFQGEVIEGNAASCLVHWDT